jgi:hypothetical protein
VKVIVALPRFKMERVSKIEPLFTQKSEGCMCTQSYSRNMKHDPLFRRSVRGLLALDRVDRLQHLPLNCVALRLGVEYGMQP